MLLSIISWSNSVWFLSQRKARDFKPSLSQLWISMNFVYQFSTLSFWYVEAMAPEETPYKSGYYYFACFNTQYRSSTSSFFFSSSVGSYAKLIMLGVPVISLFYDHWWYLLINGVSRAFATISIILVPTVWYI